MSISYRIFKGCLFNYIIVGIVFIAFIGSWCCCGLLCSCCFFPCSCCFFPCSCVWFVPLYFFSVDFEKSPDWITADVVVVVVLFDELSSSHAVIPKATPMAIITNSVFFISSRLSTKYKEVQLKHLVHIIQHNSNNVNIFNVYYVKLYYNKLNIF